LLRRERDTINLDTSTDARREGFHVEGTIKKILETCLSLKKKRDNWGERLFYKSSFNRDD